MTYAAQTELIKTSETDTNPLYSELPLQRKPSEKSPEKDKHGIKNEELHPSGGTPPPLPARNYSESSLDRLNETPLSEDSQADRTLNSDDRPDDVYATIDFHVADDTVSTSGHTEHPSRAPPRGELPLPGAEANGVLGPTGDIIGLPTRDKSKKNLVGVFAKIGNSIE